MLLVVRHADAGDKRTWTAGLDRLRPKGSTWLLERIDDRRRVRGRFLGPLVLDGELMRNG